ncbi:PREDICTED: uncharacterized protein LOC105559536 isoform X2 [Vollenhovia emeryi]|nr:PREDICTED: uncharacterized protein LOC105559536 isoform X2 [Vollenhovia emeryi]
MTTIAENRETLLQRGLSEWWSEETEYVFQRIERWAAFARGYNRLRSQRWFKNRQTMQESWSAASNETPPRFHALKRSRWKSRPEEIKINCCGTFNYQSNSKLDNNCLETYRYDHSIYFKTIGDIKSDKRDQNRNQDSASVSSEEQIEWDANSLTDPMFNKLSSEETNNNPDTGGEKDRTMQNTWPIVDISKLNLNLIDNQGRNEWLSCPADENNRGGNERQTENNNVIFLDNLKDKMDKEDQEDQEDGLNGQERFRSFRKTKRSSKNLRRSSIIGENNVAWPGVLLNYTNNFDIASDSSKDQ